MTCLTSSGSTKRQNGANQQDLRQSSRHMQRPSSLTSNDDYRLAHKEDLENIPMLSLPVSKCPEGSLDANRLSIAQRKAGLGPRKVPVLPPRLPIGAIAHDLRETQVHLSRLGTADLWPALAERRRYESQSAMLLDSAQIATRSWRNGSLSVFLHPRLRV